MTEAVTGIDLVAEQIAIAGGAGLRFRQDEVRQRGCAIECRVNAEDPQRDFAPCPGRIATATWPAAPGLRVDTHIESGSQVPPYYDSLLGKIIAHAPDRQAALRVLARAIDATRIEGVTTNLQFLGTVLRDAQFAAGGVDTGFLQRFLADRQPPAESAAHG